MAGNWRPDLVWSPGNYSASSCGTSCQPLSASLPARRVVSSTAALEQIVVITNSDLVKHCKSIRHIYLTCSKAFNFTRRASKA